MKTEKGSLCDNTEKSNREKKIPCSWKGLYNRYMNSSPAINKYNKIEMKM